MNMVSLTRICNKFSGNKIFYVEKGIFLGLPSLFQTYGLDPTGNTML
jgi:hypothetical protein